MYQEIFCQGVIFIRTCFANDMCCIERCFVPGDVLYISGDVLPVRCFVSKDVLHLEMFGRYQERFRIKRGFCTRRCCVSEDVLYQEMFCNIRCFAAGDVLYHEIFCIGGCFVSKDVLYQEMFFFQKMFCQETLHGGRLCGETCETFSEEIFSLRVRFVSGEFLSRRHFVEETFFIKRRDFVGRHFCIMRRRFVGRRFVGLHFLS